jgi:hypothetical protein
MQVSWEGEGDHEFEFECYSAMERLSIILYVKVSCNLRFVTMILRPARGVMQSRSSVSAQLLAEIARPWLFQDKDMQKESRRQAKLDEESDGISRVVLAQLCHHC